MRDISGNLLELVQ